MTQGASDLCFIIIFLIVIIYDGHCFNCSKEIITLVAKETRHIGYKSSQQKGSAKLQGWVGGVGWESTRTQLWSLKIGLAFLCDSLLWGAWSHLGPNVCRLLIHSWYFLFSIQPVGSSVSPAKSHLQTHDSQAVYCHPDPSISMFFILRASGASGTCDTQISHGPLCPGLVVNSPLETYSPCSCLHFAGSSLSWPSLTDYGDLVHF